MVDKAIYFVSDTHLGDGTGADRFRYPYELLDLISRVQAEQGAHLVLLGDFMELWACSIESVMIQHAPIFAALLQLAETHPVTLVVGNHDCLPWYYYLGRRLGNVQIEERFMTERGTLVALHGHQYDPFNNVEVASGSVKVPWTRRLVQAVGLVERLGGERAGESFTNASAALEKMLNRESPGERGYPAGEHRYLEAARRLMRGATRYVVMGHTHHPCIDRYGHRTYVNTGSWVWDRYPPTYACFAAGSLTLMRADTHSPYVPPGQDRVGGGG